MLGDLFDLWLGDDVDLTRQDAVVQALQAFHSRGGQAHVMVGNHDFLLGGEFFQAARATPLPDPTVLTLDGQRWLLTHGDELCTADVDYQALRTRIRHPAYVQNFLALPQARRVQMARELQDASHTATAHKAAAVMDVDPAAARAALETHRATVLVHGHTHRAGIERVPGNTRQAGPEVLTRITLGAWTAGPSACVWEAGRYRLIGKPD